MLGATSAGDIWSTGAFSFESPLKELLDSPDGYTIEQLLAEDELLQELRGMHPKLLEFFSSPEAVADLVKYVVLPPPKDTTMGPPEQALHLSQESKEYQHIRFPYMACEIICCEVQEVIDVLVDGHVERTGAADDSHSPPIVLTTGSHLEANTQANDSEEAPKELQKKLGSQEKGESGDSAEPSAATNLPVGDDSHPLETPTSDHISAVSPSTTRILDNLFALLYDTKPGELDDYRAGYFDKILTVLFRKRRDELSTYINEGGSRGRDALMTAMFSHLYSHSVMQIVQRLMLPPRPAPPPPPPPQEECEDEMQDGAEIMSEEIMPEDFPPEQDPGFMSDWHTSEKALEIVLSNLIEPEVPSARPEELEERKLDLSLNASEVLITVIQNSMLISETMLSLTFGETILRLMKAATVVVTKDEDGEPFFSPHESVLTSAMSVLESLILQLGGYGAVGTMFLLPEEEQALENAAGEASSDDEEAPSRLIADLRSMVDNLPFLLDSMALLLRHESTSEWKSPMQYSRTEPQQLLGCSRLRIVRVLESLVLLGDPDIDSKLVQSSCLEICLDLFWDFQWCSMLHQSVANLLVHVFEGQNARFEMQEYFLCKCNLLNRLMSSFSEVQPEGADRSTATTSSLVSDKGSADALPISEDDVDAALEHVEGEAAESKEPDSTLDGSDEVTAGVVPLDSQDQSMLAGPAQSFRLGYMGHVIIICQALVHACSTELERDEQELQMMQDGEQFEANPAMDQEQDPLLLAELVSGHELAGHWNYFVSTTLAAETEIQSSHLGGYIGNESMMLHEAMQNGHRPGLADDGDMGDDGMGPPAPPRGIGSGEGLDMDDNDLDIAANMMARLSLGRPSNEENQSDSDESGDSERSYNSGESANDRTGYVFDDPLGKAGALGIELGKLTQFRGEASPRPSTAQCTVTDDDDNDSHSSSDEEPEDRPNAGDGDVPVVDLFAGNFDSKPDEVSDFANFADVTPDDFGDFKSALPTTSIEEAQDTPRSPSKSEVDELFASTDPASLLMTEDSPIDGEENEERHVQRESAEGNVRGDNPERTSPDVDRPQVDDSPMVDTSSEPVAVAMMFEEGALTEVSDETTEVPVTANAT